jgi:neuropeptide Y receptor
MMLMVLQYFVPLLVLVFTYTRIAIVVWGKQIPGEAENVRDQRMARSKRKVCHVNILLTYVGGDTHSVALPNVEIDGRQ